MHDPMLDKLADVLVRYSTRVKKGDVVSITGDAVAMPLIEATYRAVLRAGGNPYWTPKSEALHELLLEHGSDEQIAFVQPSDLHRVQSIDVHIGFWADVNSRYLSKIDSKKVALNQSSRKPWYKVFMERAAKHAEPGGLRWVGTQYPTLSSAQDAEMSLRKYEEFVFRAGLLHLPDPVEAWKKVHDSQQRAIVFLSTKKELHFKVPPHAGNDGTDLRVDVSKALWVNCGGKENFPDGEVFTGPTLPSVGGFGANGHVNYTFPAVYQGREVEGVRLAFKDGRVVDAAARKNEKFLLDMLDQDAGARNMGEIAIGTNYSITDFSRNTLFDEKIGGTFHAAVGAGYPETGNTNESGLHWDMVCELRARGQCPGGTIAADGAVFHQNGQFLPMTGFVYAGQG